MQSGKLLSARGISKRFASNRVLEDVDFNLDPGRVHVLMGENGAGKSTLIKILSGMHRPDEGEISVDGEIRSLATPREALAAGIRVVHQEFSQVPALSVAENIHLGALPSRMNGWRLDRREMRRSAIMALELMGSDIDPDTRIENLGVAERQLVEIARSLIGDSKVIILDEPTAALSASEVGKLLDVVKRLQSRGLGIVYISHRMEEVRRVGDDVSVLRDGKVIVTAPIAAISDTDLIEAMIGRKLDQQYPQRLPRTFPSLLQVENLSLAGSFESISMSMGSGEVVGVVGPVGSGYIEFGHALFGSRPATGGQIRLNGNLSQNRSPERSIEAGFALVPEDRKRFGLMNKSSVLMNCSAAILRDLTRFCSPIDRKRERLSVSSMIKRLNVAGPGLHAAISLLSGGNQQKVVLGRWLLRGAKVFILAEPTRGVDVGAKEIIYEQINAVASEGAGVLILTSDLMEAVGMCDRLLVMRLGRVVRELSGSTLTINDTLAALYSESRDVPHS